MSTKFFYFEDDNGNQFDTAYFDGYSIGDRLLEGVMFEVKIENEQIKVLGVRDDCKQYFSRLNQESWLETAQEYVEEGGDLFCSQNGDTDLYVVCDPPRWD